MQLVLRLPLQVRQLVAALPQQVRVGSRRRVQVHPSMSATDILERSIFPGAPSEAAGASLLALAAGFSAAGLAGAPPLPAAPCIRAISRGESFFPLAGASAASFFAAGSCLQFYGPSIHEIDDDAFGPITFFVSCH